MNSTIDAGAGLVPRSIPADRPGEYDPGPLNPIIRPQLTRVVMSVEEHDSLEPTALTPEHDPYAALRDGNFRRYLGGNMLATIGVQMQTFAVSWEVYERTRDYRALMWVGLIQVLPVIFFFIPAGHIIDRFDRRRVVLCGIALLVTATTGLAANSHLRSDIRWTYLCLFFVGTARSFLQPGRQALLPQVVPRETFSNAVTWQSSGFQLAMIAGPSLGGPIIAWQKSAAGVSAACAVLAIVNFALLATVRTRPFIASTDPPSLRSLTAGMSFVWRTKMILGAITLDMFAVLLGGSVALLPAYAKEILHVDPVRLSWMRGAPGCGALVMSWILAHRPPLRRAGITLLWSVAGFGAVTIVFGLSRSFGLSLLLLFALGTLDMISVVIRHTLVQLLTPDSMRGRVSAVTSMFIGISNELGEAESGFVASLFDRGEADRAFGPIVSVVSGGIGTLVVVASVAAIWPEMRRYGRLDGSPIDAERPG